MRPKERVLTTLSLKEPDIVPIVDWVHPDFKKKVMNSEDFDETDVAYKLGLDAIYFEDCCAPYFCEYKHKGKKQFMVDGLIKEDKDLDLMEFPNPKDEGFYDPAKRFVEKYKNSDLALFSIGTLGIEGVLYSMGFVGLTHASYENPNLVKEVIDRYVEWNCIVAERLNNIGIDFIFAFDNIAFNSGPFVTPEKFRELFIPKIKEVTKVNKLPLIYHSDGDIRPLLSDLLSLEMDCLRPIEPTTLNLKEMKENYGNKVCLSGNIDLRYTLTRGTPQEVDSEVKQRIQEAGKGGGYILSSANCITDYCKVDNVLAMKEARDKYGRYPLSNDF